MTRLSREDRDRLRALKKASDDEYVEKGCWTVGEDRETTRSR